MSLNIDNFMEDLGAAYKDTQTAHGDKQAIGGILAYLVKHDYSFISKNNNREKLSKYTTRDICFILIEYFIYKVGYEKDIIELGIHPDVDSCDSYNDAKNIVANLLIRYDQKNNKIAFGDIINIIKIIQIHEKIKNYMVNAIVLDKFINKRKIDFLSVPFTIKYVNENNEEKITELSGTKIINYIKNEYNLNK